MGVSMGHSPKMQLFPHIFVWGSCFWFCTPAFSCTPPPPAALLLHIIHITHNSTHTPCRQLVLLPLLLVHTTCHHTTCHHTTCSHTTLLTNLVVNLSSQNLLTSNNLVTSTCSHNLLTQSFHVAGVVLGDIDFHFAWQAWHLWHWTGSGGALGSQLTPWLPRLLAWQAWHLETSSVDSVWQVRHLATCTCILRGRRGTYGTGLALVARLGPSWRRGRRGCLRGRRGTWRHRASILRGRYGDIDFHFAWQAWHWALDWLRWRAWAGVDAVVAAAVGVAGVALGDIQRRFCVAGVALGDIYVHSAWQAWHLWHWAGSAERRAWVPVDAVAAAAVGVAGVVLGDIERRFCVAGAALGDMYVHSGWQAWHLETSSVDSAWQVWYLATSSVDSAWQGWHLWKWAGSGCALGSQLTPWPPRLFAWQAWYLATSSVDSAWQVRHLATDVHSAWQAVLGDIERAFCVAGVALMIMALGWLWWRAWVPVDAVAAAAVCVAGVVLGDIERRFCVAGVALGDMYVLSAWQAWHLWHWAGSGPSKSLFSFLHSPCHLYLCFAACWKKLTCGFFRSFNLSRWW